MQYSTATWSPAATCGSRCWPRSPWGASSWFSALGLSSAVTAIGSRWRTWLADVAGNLDDNVAGVALVAAAPLVLRGTSYAKVTLVAAWAYCTSLMFSSSWGQLQDTWSGHAEPENSVILVFKLAILSSCAAEMALSIRRAAGR